jgi:hypothetical protein
MKSKLLQKKKPVNQSRKVVGVKQENTSEPVEAARNRTTQSTGLLAPKPLRKH